MPCALCGCWAYRCRWHYEDRDSPDPQWKRYYRDGGHPGRFWYATCSPSCEVNAVQEAANQLHEWTLWHDWEVTQLAIRTRRAISAAMATLRRAQGQKADTD